MLEDSFDGTWEANLDYVKGAGLRDPDWKPDFWRLVIKGSNVQVLKKFTRLRRDRAGLQRRHVDDRR